MMDVFIMRFSLLDVFVMRFNMLDVFITRSNALDVFVMKSNMLDIFIQIETLNLTRPDCTDHWLVTYSRKQTWKQLETCGAGLQILCIHLGHISKFCKLRGLFGKFV